MHSFICWATTTFMNIFKSEKFYVYTLFNEEKHNLYNEEKVANLNI